MFVAAVRTPEHTQAQPCHGRGPQHTYAQPCPGREPQNTHEHSRVMAGDPKTHTSIAMSWQGILEHTQAQLCCGRVGVLLSAWLSCCPCLPVGFMLSLGLMHPVGWMWKKRLLLEKGCQLSLLKALGDSSFHLKSGMSGWIWATLRDPSSVGLLEDKTH